METISFMPDSYNLFISQITVEGRMHKLKQKVQEELNTLDRNLMVLLAQVPSDEANIPPMRTVHVSVSFNQ